MKHLLLPIALLTTLAFTSCADRLKPSPMPLSRYKFDPPDGAGGSVSSYYGPSNYPGYAPAANYSSFSHRTPAHSPAVLSDAKPSANFHGGPRESYERGVTMGRRDRDFRWNPQYKRHSSTYDSITEADFARGYNDGYTNRAL